MPYESLDQALDHAVSMLRERFGDIDQQAAVSLAQVLYSLQEREEFLQRRGDADAAEMPYRS